MHKQSESPIVSFSRDGETLTLGRGPDDPTLHLDGSDGLGLAPVSIAKSDRLAGDGSIVRGVRYGDRDVFIPVLLEAASTGELSVMRRELTKLLAPHLGEVEIRVQDPATGTDRMIRGLFREGLEGTFGTEYRGSWQKVGLVFECNDPWWLGPEQIVELSLAPGVKPFLSDTVPFFPVVLAGSTVQGEFDVVITGEGQVWPSWEVVGPGDGLVISNGIEWLEVSGAFPAGSPVLFDTKTRRITPDRWADLSTRSRLFPLEQGPQTITVTLVGATSDSVVRLVYRERYMEGY